jgi:tetratricopeptide (TPR) repeat protein
LLRVAAAVDAYQDGFYDLSIREFRAAAEAQKASGTIGPESVANTQAWLAIVLDKVGSRDEALAAQREAASIVRKRFGDLHPKTQAQVNNLGWMLLKRGEYDEAERLLRETFEGRLKAYGLHHQHTLATLRNLGWLERARGDLAKAEETTRRVLDAATRTLDPSCVDLHWARANLGTILCERGRTDEGLEHLRAAHEGARAATEASGGGPWGAFATRYVKELVAAKRFDEGEALVLELIAACAAPGLESSAEEARQAAAELYDRRHEAEPGRGFDAKAAAMRGKPRE